MISAACSAMLAGCTVQPSSEPELIKYSNIAVDAGFDTPFIYTEYGTDHDLMAEHFAAGTGIWTTYNNLFDIYNDYEGINNLKTVNDNAGIAPVKVDRAVIDLLKTAKEFYDLSGGEFDITQGSLLHVWHEYREAGIALNEKNEPAPVPTEAELQEAASHSGWEYIEIDEENSTVFITEKGVSLDVGGIAKGFTAEAIGSTTENDAVYGIVDAGRNIRTMHDKADGTPWRVGVQNPSGEGSLFIVEMSGSCSAVTSGDYERFYTGEDGKRYSHIIDPDTMYPAVLYHSVTILTPDSAAADCLSTTLFTLSVEEGKKVLAEYEKRSGNPASAVWITDPDQTQGTDGVSAGGYHVCYTEDLAEKIFFQ